MNFQKQKMLMKFQKQEDVNEFLRNKKMLMNFQETKYVNEFSRNKRC